MRPEFYTGRDGNYNAIPDIAWFDKNGDIPDWDDIGVCLALRVDGSQAGSVADRDHNDFFVMFNGGEKTANFKISEPMDGKKWVRAVDTSLSSPDDIRTPGNEAALDNLQTYHVKDRSMVILISRLLY
jgi:glycogen operon protein